MNKQQAARKLYVAKDSAGNGYAPDSDSIEESVADLVNNYGGELICPAEASDDVAAVRCDDGEIVILGHKRGVWAVKVTETEWSEVAS